MPQFGDVISIGWVESLAPLGERADDKAADGQEKEEPARPVSQKPHEAPACSARRRIGPEVASPGFP